jgi:hypothetical protein
MDECVSQGSYAQWAQNNSDSRSGLASNYGLGVQQAAANMYNVPMLDGKPCSWWLRIGCVLEMRGIRNAEELERALKPARAPDDWSGY